MGATLCGARLYPAHGARGILTIDEQGRLTLLNTQRYLLLRLDDTTARSAISQPIGHLLPGSRMLSILQEQTPSLTRR